MSESTTNLTQKEIFEQICKLQEAMTSNSNALYRLSEAISPIFEGEERDENDVEAVDGVCSVFAAREETYRLMLGAYQKMYDDCQKIEKAEIIKKAFSVLTDTFETTLDLHSFDSDEERREALENIYNAIALRITGLLQDLLK